MDHKEERQFGLVFAGFFTLVAVWPLWPLHMPKLAWLAAALVSLVLGMFFQRVLTPFSRLWMSIGHGLGWINSKIILSFVFFFIITPISVLMKALGRDLLSRSLQRSNSYWVKRDATLNSESMRDQF